ncbi:MAG: folate-binding protein YgfZ [Gammaproteobacteria bacterium]
MKAEWKEFLEKAGAELCDGEVATYGNPDQELSIALTGDVFADLSHQGLIAVHGAEAETFLQGQVSNDIRQVDDTHSQLSSYCSPKGRMLASFRAFRRGDTYYLRMPASLVDTTMKRLRMFVLRAQVTLDDASNTFVQIGVSGPGVSEPLQDFFGAVPDAVDQAVQAQECTLIRVPGGHPRYEIYGPLEMMRKLWDTLNVRSAPIGSTAWALLDIMAGIPVIYPATADAFVPQMANMQLIGAVNFKKGCYPGQEVVARTQYLGKLKRRMYLGRLAAEQAPAPGDELFSPGTGTEQSVGRIVDARPHPDGGYALLAVIQIASAEGDTLHYGALDGPVMELLALPYPFADAQTGTTAS